MTPGKGHQRAVTKHVLNTAPIEGLIMCCTNQIQQHTGKIVLAPRCQHRHTGLQQAPTGQVRAQCITPHQALPTNNCQHWAPCMPVLSRLIEKISVLAGTCWIEIQQQQIRPEMTCCMPRALPVFAERLLHVSERDTHDIHLMRLGIEQCCLLPGGHPAIGARMGYPAIDPGKHLFSGPRRSGRDAIDLHRP